MDGHGYTDAEIAIWTKIRAENMQHWQKTGPNKQDVSMDKCLDIAARQFEAQVKRHGKPFVSLQELLTLGPDEANEVAHGRIQADFVAKWGAANENDK